MQYDDRPSKLENEDPQVETEIISQSDEDDDVAGSNFEYNNKDTEMVVFLSWSKRSGATL